MKSSRRASNKHTFGSTSLRDTNQSLERLQHPGKVGALVLGKLIQAPLLLPLLLKGLPPDSPSESHRCAQLAACHGHAQVQGQPRLARASHSAIVVWWLLLLVLCTQLPCRWQGFEFMQLRLKYSSVCECCTQTWTIQANSFEHSNFIFKELRSKELSQLSGPVIHIVVLLPEGLPRQP